MKKFLVGVIFIIPIVVVIALSATGAIISLTTPVNPSEMIIRNSDNEELDKSAIVKIDSKNYEEFIMIDVLPSITQDKSVTYEIVEIQGDQQEKGISLGGHKDKSEHTPDLTAEHPLRIQPQERSGCAAGKHGQQIHHHRATDDVKHEIGNTEGRMHRAPAVDSLIPSFE